MEGAAAHRHGTQAVGLAQMIIPNGTVSRAPATNMLLKRRTVASVSDSGPTMNPGVSKASPVASVTFT